jgi:hypothetical protein
MSRISDISEFKSSGAAPTGFSGVGWAVWSVVALWFVAALAASIGGFFDGGPPYGIGLAALLPVVIFLVSWAVIPSLRAYALRLSQRGLILAHMCRIIGAVFLVLYSRHLLPASFALPAGWGDIAIAVTAPLIAFNLQRLSKGTIAAWSILGMLDLLTALTMGVLNSASPLGVLAGDVTTRPMGQFPLSLIPSFAIPLLLIFHLVVLFQLRERGTGLPPGAVIPSTDSSRDRGA